MKQENVRRGIRRLTALGAASTLAASALAVGLASPAAAVPVSVTGTLTDAAGNPIDGYVSAIPVGAEGDFASQVVADGVVNLGVEPGSYKFEFRSRNGEWAPEYYNDKATYDAADAVAVSGPVPLGTVSLAAQPVITGRVVTPTGRPAAGGRVVLYAADDATRSLGGDIIQPDGTFRFGAPAGSYKVRIEPSRWAAEWYNNKPSHATAEVVNLAAGNADLGQIGVTQGSSLGGRVTNEAGAPLERVLVRASAGNGSSWSDLTDANGAYRVEELPPGDYRVEFSDPVGEYLTEYFNDKTYDTADRVTVGLDPVNDVNAALAADPAAAIDPATVDLSGTVVDSAGKPVIGASVAAYTTPAQPSRASNWDSVRTNRAGQYHFTELDGTSETQFKLQFSDNLAVEKGQFARLPRWSGDKQSYRTAAAVTVPGSNVNQVLPLTGGISGKITSESGLPVERTSITFHDAQDGPRDGYAASTSVEQDDTYSYNYLVPGKYKVLFSDGTYSLALGAHAPEWWDDATYEKAKTITVKSGETVPGIDAALNANMKVAEKPEIKGKPYVGGTIRATTGRWSLTTGTTYGYEWLLGSQVVGTGSSLKLSKSYFGKKVTLRVTAENDGVSGQAVVTTQKIKYEPKIKIKAGSAAVITIKAKKVKSKKIKGSVLVRELVKVKANGEPKYKKIGKSKVKAGKARVSLAKVKGKGKHTLVFTFKLKGKVGNAEVTKKVKRTR